MYSSSERPSSLGWRKLRLVAVLLVLGGLVAVAAGTGSASTKANPPSNKTRPTISGKAQDGRTLTTTNGTWDANPTSFTYQWYRCGPAGANCAPISGATAKHYTLTSDDVGHTIRVNVIAHNADGIGRAQSDATTVVQAVGSAPVNSTKPTISGSASVGSTLVANKGTWTGVQPITLSDQWQRCDSSGNGCADIAGATGTSYNVVGADVGHTLRIKETAKNAKGANSTPSSASDVVTPGKGGAIPVTQVNLPNLLVIDRVQFSPSPLGSRRTLTARFHVSDTRGFAIEGALVYAVGLPYSWVGNAPEATTNSSGWATIAFHPTSALPFRHGTYLVVFVRARKPGDNLLSGVSTRRLVQATIR